MVHLRGSSLPSPKARTCADNSTAATAAPLLKSAVSTHLRSVACKFLMCWSYDGGCMPIISAGRCTSPSPGLAQDRKFESTHPVSSARHRWPDGSISCAHDHEIPYASCAYDASRNLQFLAARVPNWSRCGNVRVLSMRVSFEGVGAARDPLYVCACIFKRVHFP
eukprot:352421-Chlamydomonas_euryale.AAC.9